MEGQGFSAYKHFHFFLLYPQIYGEIEPETILLLILNIPDILQTLQVIWEIIIFFISEQMAAALMRGV